LRLSIFGHHFASLAAIVVVDVDCVGRTLPDEGLKEGSELGETYYDGVKLGSEDGSENTVGIFVGCKVRSLVGSCIGMTISCTGASEVGSTDASLFVGHGVSFGVGCVVSIRSLVGMGVGCIVGFINGWLDGVDEGPIVKKSIVVFVSDTSSWHQRRSLYPGKSASSISFFDPPTPKNAMLPLIKHP